VTFDLYAWQEPRDLDADEAAAMLESWHAAGADPSQSPFEPSTNVGWFYRELSGDAPGLDAVTDAVPRESKAPFWLAGSDEAPARLVAIRLPQSAVDVIDEIYSLAMKYDLVLFDARNRRIHVPLEEMSEYASATFWPRGAIQAAVAGIAGGAIAFVAWTLGIPLMSGLVALAGGFMFVMAVYTFVHEGRKAGDSRHRGGEPPAR
jgi:hypothetical protein